MTSQGASYGLERCIVVDCRYGYEYAGGCIQGAVSINTPDDMDRWVGVQPPEPSTLTLTLENKPVDGWAAGVGAGRAILHVH